MGNGSTNKGQSYGFQVDFLKNLSGTKSNKESNAGNLLMYISEQTQKHFPHAMEWISEFEMLEQPSKMDPADFENEIDEIVKPFAEIQKIIGDIRVLDDGDNEGSCVTFKLEGPKGLEKELKEFFKGAFKADDALDDTLPYGLKVDFKCKCQKKDSEEDEDVKADEDEELEDKEIEENWEYVCDAECYISNAAEHALKVVQSNPEVKVADTSLILGESEIIYRDKFMDIMGDFEVEAKEKLDKLEKSYSDLQKLLKDTCKKFGSKDTTKWIDFAAYITDFMEEWKKARQQIAKIEAALAKEAKDKARKEGKKKGKKKLRDLMKKRGKKEDLEKKGVIKNVDDVRKASKTKTDTMMLLGNHLAVLNKQTRLQEKRKRTASFFMPSREGKYGRERGRMHTFQSDLREELSKASRRSLTSLGTAPILGVEQEVETTRARRTIAVPNRRRRQTTNHLEDPNADLSREDWIAKLLGKPMPSKEEELP